ncbi:MAG TPA: VCBS repeat-containing protein, partial [Puia sp.]|nr:VCBS repeat-containing protein [Puia sp.]
MQTKDHTLSGTRSVNLYAKLFIISTASIFGLLLLSPDPRVHPGDTRTQATSKTDITSAAKKIINESNRLHKTAVARALKAPLDTNQLKQSDWFTAVTQDIEKRMYSIAADKDPETFQSINRAQDLKASYSPYQFSIQKLPLQDKKQQLQNDWQLSIVVMGLFENGKSFKRPQSTVSQVAGEDNTVEYNFGDAYSIQYQNSAKGIRQNFIVRQKPASSVQELKVSMKAKGDWVVNKVHDRELHFAKKKGPDGLENKITYNDLRAWDANGKPLTARMEVVGDNNFDIITEVAGAAYPVTIDPLSTTPSTTLTGSGNFGWSAASAGDVNGDGYSDVVVGDASGHAYIYLGSASGLSSSIATTLSGGVNFGTSVASAGDVNGDGFSDVIVGDARGNAFVYLGSSSGLSAVPATTISGLGAFGGGISVASAGDVNGDGFSDVVVSAVPSNNAYIYLGSALGLSGTIATTLHEATGNFGATVACAGDVNGDGFSDVVVGDAAGKAYVFLGAGGGLSSVASVTLTEAGVNFGWSVASAGDVNGDGYSDVIVGDHGGNAYVFPGSIAGLSTTASATLTGSPKFGTSVASAGDV